MQWLRSVFSISLLVVTVLIVDGALSGFHERQFRVKRQYCLNYPCPPGSTPDVPNWGYYNYYNYPYYGY
ncbi:hypothetical protein QR680_003520 [Steinernema hermaphroditum]|uniref:Uncharacterized protein n=1 Tax=Steinernema hermaphroditum TaxID=289476 RepID=A0AA39HKP1_9BILA|nr:hypothetical protein QR680_003520 [Steinernema hermaphroditum]